MHDLAVALRKLRSSPMFTAGLIAMPALGIGVNAAMFSIVHAVLWAPLPVLDPQSLVVVARTTQAAPSPRAATLNVADYLHLRSSGIFSQLAAFDTFRQGIMIDGSAGVAVGEIVSANYFDVLGVNPVLGRTFSSVEEAGGGPVTPAIISERLWIQYFNRAPTAIGAVIRVRQVPLAIVGVVPRSFEGLSLPRLLRTDLWVPLAVSAAIRGSASPGGDPRTLQLRGRLAAGLTIEQARDRMLTVSEQLNESAPASIEPGERLTVVTGEPPKSLDRTLSPVGGALLVLVGLVLLIGAINAATMILSRGAARQSEIAVRASLGATRLRIIRMLAAEYSLLAVAGGMSGLLLAAWLVKIANGVTLPALDGHLLTVHARIDGSVFGYCVALTILTGAISAVVPAFRSSRVDVMKGLAGERSLALPRQRPFGLRHAALVPQLAVSLLLLVVAGLIIRGVISLNHAPLGFDADRIAAVGANFDLHGIDAGRANRMMRDLTRVARTLEGVASASLVDRMPLTGSGQGFQFQVPERSYTSGRPFDTAGGLRVGPAFFATMGIPLLHGREFSSVDVEGAPVAVIVSRSLAHRIWGTTDVLGRTIAVHPNARSKADLTSGRIIGVAADASLRRIGENSYGGLYLAASQFPGTELHVIVRGRDSGRQALTALDRSMRSRFPDVAILTSRTLREQTDLLLLPMRAGAWALGILGGFGLLLATVGLFAALSYAVAGRTQELGIRAALGGTPSDLVGMVLLDGGKVVAAGIIFGLMLSYMATLVLPAVMFGVGEPDLLTFVLVPALLAIVALLACWLPARRVAAIDPLKALRQL